jgi:hypothetical protein
MIHRDGTGDAPIFIVGVHRSGTTLLRYMLSSSPRIYVPPESDFIPRFFGGRPEAKLDRDRVARLLRLIFKHYRFVKEWQGEPPNPDRFFQEMEGRTPSAFLDTLYRRYAEQHGASRWGDKTPIYTSYIPLIHRLFPRAQFLHIIRDGRDVALSTLDTWGESELHVDLYYAARIWVRRIRQARQAGGQLGPGLYREVRYESLVQDPEGQLRAICEFLGEPYLPQMARQHRQAQERIQPEGFHAPVRRPPNRGRVDRWRREMPDGDQRLFQRVAGSLLQELGYPTVELGPMSAQERVRHAALHAKYEALQGGRRLAQTVGLVPPIYGANGRRRIASRAQR